MPWFSHQSARSSMMPNVRHPHKMVPEELTHPYAGYLPGPRVFTRRGVQPARPNAWCNGDVSGYQVSSCTHPSMQPASWGVASDWDAEFDWTQTPSFRVSGNTGSDKECIFHQNHPKSTTVSDSVKDLSKAASANTHLFGGAEERRFLTRERQDTLLRYFSKNLGPQEPTNRIYGMNCRKKKLGITICRRKTGLVTSPTICGNIATCSTWRHARGALRGVEPSRVLSTTWYLEGWKLLRNKDLEDTSHGTLWHHGKCKNFLALCCRLLPMWWNIFQHLMAKKQGTQAAHQLASAHTHTQLLR